MDEPSKPPRKEIAIQRSTMLIEIVRRCADPQCNWNNRVGLTKHEAREYNGFECERCELWTADSLSEGDIPESWEELFVFGINTPFVATEKAPRYEDDFMFRLSKQWREARKLKRDESSGEGKRKSDPADIEP